MPDLAVQKRDGYAEMVEAFLNARFAVAQIKDAKTDLRDALADIANAVAVTGDLESWEGVLVTPYGDRRMPNPVTLAAGEKAHTFRTLFEEDGNPPSEDEFDQLEEMIREAIENAGPGVELREKLDALWNGKGGDDV